MKKIMFILAITALLFLSSCSNYEHNYKMYCDENMHWIECECGSCLKKECHSFSDWEIIYEPCEYMQGRRGKKCKYCGYTIKEDYGVYVNVDADQGGKVSNSGYYNEGDEVHLDATPDEGYIFTGWYSRGDFCSINPKYSFKLDKEDLHFSARFEAIDNIITFNLSEDLSYYEVAKCDYSFDIYLSIPSEYKGIPVKKICKNAFSNRNILGVSIPNSIIEIEEGAFSNCKSLKSVEIFSGVTKIPCDAFKGCENLESVILPDSIEEIEEGAFSNCSSLRDIEIPKGIKKISRNTFSGCKVLKSIAIPEGVEEIEECAFDGCNWLTSITISKNVTNISNYAFRGCNNLLKIEVDEENPRYDSRNNCNAIIDKNNGTLILGCNESIVPSGVTKIGDYAFSQCIDLKKLVIPSSVTEIGEFAFESSGIENITLSSDLEKIGDNAFQYCNNLEEITIPNSVTDIGESLFFKCDRLKKVKLSQNLNSLKRRTFAYCSNLKSVSLPDSLEEIESSAFYKCESIGNVTIPSGVTKIESYAFANSSIASIDMLNGSGNIGEGAFSNCEQLSNVKLPMAMKEIPNKMFEGCTSLVNVEIPTSVTDIGEAAFNGCGRLSSIIIPKNISNIGLKAFTNCGNLTSIVVDNDNSTFDSRNNCNAIIKKGFNELIAGCSKTIIPDTVWKVGQSAFEGCKFLNIDIPNSVTRINSCAFKNTGLKSINIPDSVTTVNEEAFKDCIYLEDVTISVNLDKISQSMFLGCKSLKCIEIPENIKTIEQYAFSNTGLVHVETPKSADVYSDAFSNCSNLESIIIRNSNQYYYSFEYCPKLECIELRGKLRNLSLYSCPALATILIPSSLSNIYLSYDTCISKVYYSSTQSDWKNIDGINKIEDSATIYFYSEEKPSEIGNFWHYVDDKVTIW